ncbi:MAG: bifunctional metallophosphatase/5'-nucleotidase [Rubricoccaceae bacterium]
MRLALLAALSLLLLPLAAAQAPADTTRIVVMATTDLHGHLLPWDYYADRPDERLGLAKVATLVDSVRAAHAHTLLVDAGDFFQGNPFAEFFAREDSLGTSPTVAAFDALAYDAAVLGNHEFNFGLGVLHRRLRQTATPMLAANVTLAGTDAPAYAPYVLRRVGTLTVGIVGLTTPGSAVWDRPRVAGRLAFGDGVAAARRYVAEARARGADVVVVVAHSGLEGPSSFSAEGLGAENFGRAVAETVPGVDALVIGHSHRTLATALAGADGRPVPVVQAGRWGDHLGVIELALVRASDGAARVAAHAVRVHPVRHARAHPTVVALAAEGHEAVRAFLAEPVATTSGLWPTERGRLEPTAAVGLIHAAQRAATGAQLSAASAFTTALTLGPDGLSRAQLAQLYPYENALYTVRISGRDLRAYLEHGAQYYLPPDTPGAAPRVNPRWPGYNFDAIDGVTYTLDLARPVGERVQGLAFGGRPVRDDDVFTMAVNSYRAEGGGGFPGMTPEAVVAQIDRPVRALIEDFLAERGHVAPEDVLGTTTWRVTPEPAGSR